MCTSYLASVHYFLSCVETHWHLLIVSKRLSKNISHVLIWCTFLIMIPARKSFDTSGKIRLTCKCAYGNFLS